MRGNAFDWTIGVQKLRKYEIYDPPTLEDEIDNNRGQCQKKMIVNE